MDTFGIDDLATMINRLQEDMKNSVNTIETKISSIENSIDNINTRINTIDHKLNSQQMYHGPKSFLDALSPSAITGAPTRHINPAYQE